MGNATACRLGVGIRKIANIRDEMKGISEKHIPLTKVVSKITTNQLEQSVCLERALRFGEVAITKGDARKGLLSDVHCDDPLAPPEVIVKEIMKIIQQRRKA